MKNTMFSAVTLAVTSMMMTAVSCSDTNTLPDSGQNSNTGNGSVRVSAPFVDQTTDFAFDLAKRVSDEEEDKNVFVSPLSMHMLLGMIMNGANGQTAGEIQKTLKLDAQTLAEANLTYQNLVQNLPDVDSKVKLTIANSVWYRNTFSVEPSFQNSSKDTFKAEISAQDFNDATKTLANINGWASEQTNGKIPKVLDQIGRDNVMFLLNALYFKGDWKTQFKTEQTIDAPFTLTDGTEKTVRMMRLNTTLRRAFQPTYTAFELPYGSDKYAMTVLLPSANTSAEAVLSGLNGSGWKQLQQDLKEGSIDIGLPKFTLKYQVKLNDILSAMGMPTAFTDQADFTRMNAQGGLTLSFVKQDTYVAVDEKGTEAAAVSTGGISVTSAGPGPVLCDRPFVFVIHEKTSGTVLFVGKIANPESNL